MEIRSAQKLLSLALTILLATSSSMGTAAASAPRPAVEGPFKISPDRIQAGKTRDVTITTENGDLKSVDPEPPPSGSGITFESVSGQNILRPDDKTIIVRIKVSEDADRGTVPISLIKKEADKAPVVVGVVNLEITEFRPTKIERGPTPDDIDFEVDAIWTVVPYNIVKANFGRKTADAFYAVEVYIGNNTGFDLQIVGVGFETSRRRTVDKYGIPLAFLMNDKGVPVTDEYGNKFIEAVDDKGERILQPDGMPTFRVFRKFQLPTSDHRLVRGTIELDQLYGRRALALNLIGGVGTLVSGFIPFFRAPNPKANFSTFSSILNGQLKEGFAIAAPDLTVNQLNRLENVVLHEGLTVLNNSQARTIVFFPRHIVGLSSADMKEMEKSGSMWTVLERLGELIIVGKPIVTYRNREIVATKPQPPAPPAPAGTGAIAAPTVTSISPNTSAVGTTITITGTNFVPGTQVLFNGVPAASVAFITATQLNAVVPAEALTGPITVKTPSGSDKSPMDFVAHPRIKKVNPPIVVPGKAITIEGENLEAVTTVNFGTVPVPKAGFLSQDKNKIVVNAPPKAESSIKVVAPSGAETTAPDVPAQPILDPLQTNQGKAGDLIKITGKNLTNAQVFFGDAPAEVTNPGATGIEVRVPKNATSGPITVRTAPELEKKTEDFTFFPAPVIVNFSVNKGAPVDQVAIKAGDEVVIGGQNLKGAKVNLGANEIPATSDDNKITFKVPEGLPAGKITIVTPGGEVTPEKLTFIPAPVITTFSVNGGQAQDEASGKTGDTVVINGENFDGLSAVKFADTTVSFTNPKEKQFTVTLPTLPAGKIKIEVTTPGGKAVTEKFTITQ